MRLTNKLNLPQPIVSAIANDSYSKGDADISVTELIDPPMLVALKKRYANDLSEDVSDRIFSLLGQSIHSILERADTTAVVERRLSILIEGWKVSGSMDRFVLSNGLLQDYKLTTVYKVKGGRLPEEWVKQLNIYAEILRQNGETVKTLQIVALLRDWSKGLVEREEGVPTQQCVVIDIPLIPEEEVIEYIRAQVLAHQDAQVRDQYSPCTKEERWAKDDVYAVMKKGQKRALRLCNSQEAADLHISTLPKGMYSVEYREGESTRCKSYCPVSKHCKVAKERGWVK